LFNDAVYTILSSAAGVTAITSTRIYPIQAPQNVTKPYITYQRISTERDYTLGGPDGLVNAILQVDCWAATNDAARSLADAVRLAFDDYRGTSSSVVIQGTFLHNDFDNWEQELAGGEPLLHRVTLEFSAWYEETAA
jgi:hypothetical protein